MTDPTNPEFPTLAEVIREKIRDSRVREVLAGERGDLIRAHHENGEQRGLAGLDIAPYDALIASQAEEIARLTAENAELRKSHRALRDDMEKLYLEWGPALDTGEVMDLLSKHSPMAREKKEQPHD